MPDVQTPSSPAVTPRGDRLRRPLDSPFPLSSYPPPSALSSTHGLSERHLREIETVFRIFDPALSGSIDLATFEVLVRSLGFRMTRVEIAGTVEMMWEERLQQQGHAAADQSMADADERRRVDLPMAAQILSERGYARRCEEDEIRMYFRIFDGGNKGHITLEDLKRVQREARAAEREMDVAGSDAVGDATLEAMIEQFDRNRDGVIDYEEFKNVLEPVLSSSSSSS